MTHVFFLILVTFIYFFIAFSLPRRLPLPPPPFCQQQQNNLGCFQNNQKSYLFPFFKKMSSLEIFLLLFFVMTHLMSTSSVASHTLLGVRNMSLCQL